MLSKTITPCSGGWTTKRNQWRLLSMLQGITSRSWLRMLLIPFNTCFAGTAPTPFSNFSQVITSICTFLLQPGHLIWSSFHFPHSSFFSLLHHMTPEQFFVFLETVHRQLGKELGFSFYLVSEDFFGLSLLLFQGFENSWTLHVFLELCSRFLAAWTLFFSRSFSDLNLDFSVSDMVLFFSAYFLCPFSCIPHVY